MNFLPRNQVSPIVRVIDDLQKESSKELEHFLKLYGWECSSGLDLVDRLVEYRLDLEWLFESVDLEQKFFLMSAFESKNWKNLRRYFALSRKFQVHKQQHHSYYQKGTEILWNRFFTDLQALEIDQQSHLYINLKNYLDWSNYQKELQNQVTIAKILYPFVRSLQNVASVPNSFLREGLKLVLFLNPKHASALLDYGAMLEKENRIDSVMNLYAGAIRASLLDKNLILNYLELTARIHKTEELDRMASHIFGLKIVDFEPKTYARIAELLLKKDLLIPAFFYLLKAHSFRKDETAFLPRIKDLAYRLGFYSLAASFSSGLEQEVIIQIPEHSAFLSRFSSVEEFQPVRAGYILLASRRMTQIHFCLASTGREFIFFPRPGYYELLSEGRILKLSPVLPPDGGSEGQFTYSDFSISLKPGLLSQLTPFHFMREERIPLEEEDMASGSI